VEKLEEREEPRENQDADVVENTSSVSITVTEYMDTQESDETESAKLDSETCVEIKNSETSVAINNSETTAEITKDSVSCESGLKIYVVDSDLDSETCAGTNKQFELEGKQEISSIVVLKLNSETCDEKLNTENESDKKQTSENEKPSADNKLESGANEKEKKILSEEIDNIDTLTAEIKLNE